MLLGFAIYVAFIIGFLLWDAKFGFGFEWDGDNYPPLLLAAIFWWITLPYVFMSKFVSFLDGLKTVRKERENVRVRVKLENDKFQAEQEKAINEAMKEVDLEMAEFNEKLKATSRK